MNSAVTAKTIKENIARARAYMRRNDLSRTLHTLALTMSEYAGQHIMGPSRYEIEVGFNEVLIDCSRHPDIQPLLIPPGSTKPVGLKFMRGKEPELIKIVNSLAQQIDSVAIDKEQSERTQLEERKTTLMKQGCHALALGDKPKGRALLRKLLDDYGDTPELFLDVTSELLNAQLPLDAAEMLESGIERLPKSTALYTVAINIYVENGEYSRAEVLYVKVLKLFGTHPRTLCNMARMYYAWGQRQKAEDIVCNILQNDPNHVEGRQLLTQIEERTL